MAKIPTVKTVGSESFLKLLKEGVSSFRIEWATSPNMEVKSGLSGGSFLLKNKQNLMAKRARRHLRRSVQRGTYLPVLTSGRSVTTGILSPYFGRFSVNLFFTWFSCKMLKDGIFCANYVHWIQLSRSERIMIGKYIIIT